MCTDYHKSQLPLDLSDLCAIFIEGEIVGGGGVYTVKMYHEL
jgi:hypothetical protein